MKIKNLLFIIFCGALFGLAGIQNASAATIITCYSNCSPAYTNVVGVYTLDLQCNATSPTSYTAQLTVNGVAGSVNTKYCACTYTGPVGPWAPACYATGTWNTPSGSNATINNTVAGYTGAVVYSCSNGVYSWVSQSCTAPPPTLSTSFSPSSIAYNSSATISWSSANTNSCYGYSVGSAGATWNTGGWNAIATSGSASTGVLSSTSSFYIYCAGKNGTNVFSSPYPMTVTVTPASCALPWGGSITSGTSATAYQSSSVVSPATCTSQSRTCTNGTLSGTYTNSGCTVTAASCTLPWGGSITSGNSATAYQSSSVVSPATCTSQSRTCTNGSLSGTYTNSGCTVTAASVPTAPTISGPTTLITGHSGTYSFVSTDPQGEQISYAVDWNSDGTDLWMPYGSVPPPGGMTYVNSGVSQSASKSWATPGTYTVRVLAQDTMGNNSAWTTYTITVSDPQPCTAGVVDSVGSWAPTCSTSATCTTPPSPTQLTNQPGIQIGICPTPEYTGNAYRSCSTATITCTPASSCGDGTCNGSETLLTCPADCKARYQQF